MKYHVNYTTRLRRREGARKVCHHMVFMEGCVGITEKRREYDGQRFRTGVIAVPPIGNDRGSMEG